ncbi:hypothetical protein CH063_13425, partial [Colletotrichum higginsianum]
AGEHQYRDSKSVPPVWKDFRPVFCEASRLRISCIALDGLVEMTRTTLDRHDIGPGVEIHSVGGHTAPRRKDAWVRYFLDPEESRHNRGGAYRSGALRYVYSRL